MAETTPGLDENLSARPGLMRVSIDGEAIVVDEDNARLHHLDALATAVWSSLDSGTTLRQTCLALATRFEVDVQRVHADVLSLTADLLAKGLLVREPLPATPPSAPVRPTASGDAGP